MKFRDIINSGVMKEEKAAMGNGKRNFFIFSPQIVKQITFIILNCFLLVTNCFAVDFLFRPKGFLFIPLGPGNVTSGGDTRYSLGGGGDIDFEVDLSTIWPNSLGLGFTAGLEGGMLISAMNMNEEAAKNLQVYSMGAGLGMYWFPFSRLLTRLDGTVGVYQPVLDKAKGDPNLFFRGGLEAGFRFTPAFTLALNAGWRQYFDFKSSSSGGAVTGLYTGLTAQFTFAAGNKSGREGIASSLEQDDPVYPAFMQLYQNNAMGTVVIRNNENAEIRNLRLSFRASGYTASEFPCGTVSLLPRGRSAELPLLADFSPAILRFTDTGRILGEFVIRYSFLGQERESVHAVIVAAHNRNTVIEDDVSALAAFISPSSPETMEFAKYITGIARSNRRSGHNEQMQFAVWLFEGLRTAGMRMGTSFALPAEVQFPGETLAYGMGNGRDLSLLYAAALESVGISSALIKLEDDLLTAVSLNIGQTGAETLFNGLDNIFIINGEVWLPLNMNAFNEGFMAAWAQGAAVLNKTFARGGKADFINVEQAWASYPPAPLPEQGGVNIHADPDAALAAADRVMQQYIDQELQPILRQVQTQVNANPTAALINRLGMLQHRVGRVSDAKASYERAAGLGLVAAMNNRGSLALAEKDYTGAERWFRQALARESDNSTALKGLELAEGRR